MADTTHTPVVYPASFTAVDSHFAILAIFRLAIIRHFHLFRSLGW